MRPLILGARGSSLAVRQAQIIQARLEALSPGRTFLLETITSQADTHPDLPLAAMSGEGVFVKELESALAGGRIDVAVHSLKDLPLETPPGLRIAAVPEREEPRDALVSGSHESLEQLPKGARIGTSSVRRQSQLRRRRPDLAMLEIRGNVDTRIRKLDEGRYDAIVVAACGLIRLGLKERITELLDVSDMLPEPGQGALAVQARADDREAFAAVEPIEDSMSRACVEAERAFLRALGGGCRVPIAAYASMKHGMLELEGAVIAPDGRDARRGTLTGPITEPIALGERLADHLAAQGARELLDFKR